MEIYYVTLYIRYSDLLLPRNNNNKFPVLCYKKKHHRYEVCRTKISLLGRLLYESLTELQLSLDDSRRVQHTSLPTVLGGDSDATISLCGLCAVSINKLPLNHISPNLSHALMQSTIMDANLRIIKLHLIVETCYRYIVLMFCASS